MERLFDRNSFQDEITNASEAQACYDYYTRNLSAFRSQLANEGLSYEDIEKEIRQGWVNLLKSCKRVGYANPHLVRMAKKYVGGSDKAEG